MIALRRPLLDSLAAVSYRGCTMVLRSSALILALCAAACGPNRIRILVPPRLDLKTYGRLGLVTFSVENAKGSLPQLVTDRFEEEALTPHPGIQIFELGPAASPRPPPPP